MRRTVCLILVVVAAAASSAAFGADSCCAAKSCAISGAGPIPDNTLTPAEKRAGWRLLFDGKTLSGWGGGPPDGGWVIENGAIYLKNPGHGMLYTKERFGNFELAADFMVDKGTNSGIFFRWDKLNDPVQTGIEMQVLDSAAETQVDKHSCGAIYDCLAPSVNAMKPAGEWNSVVIKCKANMIRITMNGKQIIGMDLNKWTEPHKNPDGSGNKFGTAYKDMSRVGYIGFQDHGSRVWYKNVKIRKE